MNQRRSSFAAISLGVHAMIVGVVLIVPIFTPLPLPALIAPGLAWAPQRVVQPVDIDLPAPASARPRPAAAGAAPLASPPAAPAPSPVEPPSGIAPESGRETIASSTMSSVSAVERGAGSVDGVGFGIAESAPVSPAPAPAREPQRLHQGIQAPRKTVDVAPRYPSLARDSRVEGIVILDVIIDERGNVASTRVLRSVPVLDQAAIDAVQQWKFTPARLNGVPIPIVMTVTVSFRLQ